MGRKGVLFAVLLVSIFSLAACAGVGGYTQPAGLMPMGWIYTNSTSGTQILEPGVTPTKEGRACGDYIVFVGTGDTSIETAMKNGGIKKVVFVTHSVKMVLGSIYGEVCTIVRGN